MSLIQEALDKASKLQNPPQAQPSAQTEKKVRESIKDEEIILKRLTRPRFERSPKKMPAVSRPGKIILAAAVLGFIALCFFLFFGKKTQTTAPMLMSGMSSIPQMPKAPEIPVFELNGITESNGAKLALINNQVAGTGDRLKEKAFVKSIDAGMVVLDYNGREIKLTL